MKPKLLLSFFLLCYLNLFSQPGKLTIIPGTKCSLIPPEGFVLSENFSGFHQEETGASIMINELPAPYQAMADGFTAEALFKQGVTLVSKETISFNGSKAIYITALQPAKGTTYLKQMLIFGDANQTILLNGIYPEASKDIEPEIKKSLLSTVFNPSQNEDPLAAANFSIDTKGSEFKLVKYISGSLLYSTDGKMPTEKPILIVGSSIAKIAAQNQRKYAEERIKKLPRGEQNMVKEIKEITIDKMSGYEIIAEGRSKDDKPELIYQVMLFNDQGDYYLIVGQTKEDFNGYLDVFKNIAKTFKRK